MDNPNPYRGWYVSIATTGRLVAGPFQDRERCVKECLLRSSELTLTRAKFSKEVNLYYVPKFSNGNDSR